AAGISLAARASPRQKNSFHAAADSGEVLEAGCDVEVTTWAIRSARKANKCACSWGESCVTRCWTWSSVLSVMYASFPRIASIVPHDHLTKRFFTLHIEVGGRTWCRELFRNRRSLLQCAYCSESRGNVLGGADGQRHDGEGRGRGA